MRLARGFLLAVWLGSSAYGATLAEHGPRDVTLASGAVVRVAAGELAVPESRLRPSPRRVIIPYYLLRSESDTPAAPIFLLAGGPGASWIDQFKRDENYREVAFYRSLADVVLFDQRGAGHARPAMTCTETAPLPSDRPFNPKAVRAAMRLAATACRDRWLREGVDLAAYNTVENAADLNDLRLALGYGKITLVGGSYGAHLALQFLRQFPDSVERILIYGVEGPDHTWDDPTALLATLRRIADATQQAPTYAGPIPAEGLLAVLERIITRLEAKPVTVPITDGGSTKNVIVNADLVRFMARRNAGRRNDAAAWPDMLMAMDGGDFSRAARVALSLREVSIADPMHHSMDCASGVSPARAKRLRNSSARRLLGDLNLEYEAICAIWPHAKLGAAYRAPVTSNVPALLIHGTGTCRPR
ncbi:MAG: alpha/beta hydrolase [Gammaproteobacteria bacterium]|nr:alpha/beta hydrolase [Gammaproteobacteria bacterium]